MDKKLLKLNGLVSLINKFIAIICSLILPRMMILAFGSRLNGLTASIMQYLSLITLLDLGMGSVIQASLYKPLFQKDYDQVSTVFYKSKCFFNKIGLALLIYISFLVIFLPRNLEPLLENKQTVLLILILAMGQLTQFFIGISSQLILLSDQKGYIKEILQGTSNLLNLFLTYVLIKSNQGLLSVKFGSSLIFLLPPLLMSLYVKKYYHLSKDRADKTFQLGQQWYGIGQHIAYTVQESTDIVILSSFSTLSNVSIYSVYNTVINGIKMILNAVTSGIRPFLGQSLHSHDKEKIISQFHHLEWLFYALSTVVLCVSFQLITPFVGIYTSDVTDAQYKQYLFGFLMMLSLFCYSIRLPYRSLVFAAGHFKETQAGTYLEAIINLAFSLALVKPFGLIGVAIGTLLSLAFSQFYYLYYVYRRYFKISYRWVIKQLALSLVVFLLSNLIFLGLASNVANVWTWIGFAIVSSLVTGFMLLGGNLLLDRKETMSYLKGLLR